MDAATIQLAGEVFQEAADAPASERAAVLDRRCAGNPGLRTFVEQMLAELGSDQDGPLDAPLLTGHGVRIPTDMADSRATRIGRYEVIRVLGEGGMAVVYEARQQSPSRTVALKVMRPGVLSDELVRRFLHEVQVLGRLQHPGIAHIYEAAVGEATLTGGMKVPQPYFAMELIRGHPLTTFATQHSLTDADKLELVAKVCDAVQYAHQQGVIHRDLKPANILVEESAPTDEDTKVRTGGSSSSLRFGDGAHGARPKVLDFGVARMAAADGTAVTMNTEAGRLIGTLAYMSPEQVGGHVEDIDTRSDTYALGVILYELMSGRLPFDVTSVQLAEGVRRVREDTPPALGTLNPRHRGDIEVITARAMARDKARRYQSAADLATDLRRFLRGEAIEARRDSAIYVLRKGVRKYRGLVAAAVAAFLGLGAFAAYAWHQAGRYQLLSDSEHSARVSAENATIAAERARAETDHARIAAVSVKDFLEGVIALAGSEGGKGYTLSLTDMLDDATQRLDKGELSKDPAVEAEVRDAISKTYGKLELMDGAAVHQRWLVEYQKNHAGAHSKAYMEALRVLGTSYVEGGHQPQGQQVLIEALAICKEINGPESMQTYNLMISIGNSLMRDKRGEEALAYTLPAAQGVERLKGPDSFSTAFCYWDLSGVYRNLGRTQDMVDSYEKAMPVMNRKAPDAISTIRARWYYALDCFHRRGKSAEAEQMLREAIPLAIKSQGAEHPETLATQRALASVLIDRNELDEAKALLTSSLDVARNVRRWVLPFESTIVIELARCLRKMKQYDEALNELHTTFDRIERSRTQTDEGALSLLGAISECHRENGDRTAAAAALDEAIKRLIDKGHADDPRIEQWTQRAATLRAQTP